MTGVLAAMSAAIAVAALTLRWSGRAQQRTAPAASLRPPRPTLIEALNTAARQARVAEPWRSTLTEAIASARAAPNDVAIAEHALGLAGRVGSHDAAILDSAASTLRARQAVRDDIAVHSAQARLSARILTILPVAVAALNGLSERGRNALSSTAGVVCLTFGALLNTIGWWWMRRQIRRVEQ